jgi:hypothetical protein
VDDTKNKDVGLGEQVNNPIFSYDDLPVIKLIDLRELMGDDIFTFWLSIR